MMLLLDFLHVFYFYHFFFESLWALPLFQLHYSLSSFLLSVFCTEFSSVYFPLRSFPLYLHFWDRFAFFLLFPPWVLTAHVSPPLAILSSFPEFLFLLCSWLFFFFFIEMIASLGSLYSWWNTSLQLFSSPPYIYLGMFLIWGTFYGYCWYFFTVESLLLFYQYSRFLISLLLLTVVWVDFLWPAVLQEVLEGQTEEPG